MTMPSNPRVADGIRDAKAELGHHTDRDQHHECSATAMLQDAASVAAAGAAGNLRARRIGVDMNMGIPGGSEETALAGHFPTFCWNNAVWPEQLDDHELLQASTMRSIAPTVLRPGALSSRSAVPGSANPNSNIAATTTTTTNSHIGGNEPALPHYSTPSVDVPGGNQVKFVNATVEILQNQIRKEEAPKKKRTRTTPEQLRILQKAFATDPMPNSGARLGLAKKLGMNARAVQVWFQNRRAKEKLEAKRAEATQHKERASSFSTADLSYVRDQSHQPLVAFIKHGSGMMYRHPEEGPGAGNGTNVTPQTTTATATTTPLYDLGMYFGDQEQYAQALAQYAANFDISSSYACPIGLEGIQQAPLFDDIDASQASLADGAEVGQMFTRLQSLPTNYTYTEMGNALGIVFNDLASGGNVQRDGAPGTLGVATGGGSGEGGGQEGNLSLPLQRSHSIDVLSMIGDAAGIPSGREQQEGKIFCKPASSETFLTAMPLGQSVPMPNKPRSLSVPEITNQIKDTLNYQSDLFRSHDLLAIKEEDLNMADMPAPVKRMSSAGIGNFASLQPTLTGGLAVLDDIQAYLEGMNVQSRYD